MNICSHRLLLVSCIARAAQLTAFVVIYVAVLPASAKAQTLVADNFDRGTVESPLALDGSTPSTSHIGAVTWTSANWLTDGTQAVLNPIARHNAIFSYNFTPGFVYTLSATLDVTDGTGSNFLGLAFYGTSPSTNGIILSGTDKQGIMLRADGIVRGITNGGAINLGTGYSSATRLSAILDTTVAAWTMSFAIDGSPVGSLETLSTNPVLTGFGFGANNVAGTVDNFSLTAVVPEPSTITLAAFGFSSIAALVALRRRNRRSPQ
jgi:hypothetical protein